LTNTEKLNTPLYLVVAANILASECKKMVENTIENNQPLDLKTLSKYISMLQNSLDQSTEELKKKNVDVQTSKEEINNLFNFKN